MGKQQDEARRTFGDVLARYDLRSVDGRRVVAAASGLLVADGDGPAATDLASVVVTPLTSPFQIDALVALARDELGMPGSSTVLGLLSHNHLLQATLEAP